MIPLAALWALQSEFPRAGEEIVDTGSVRVSYSEDATNLDFVLAAVAVLVLLVIIYLKLPDLDELAANDDGE